MHEHYISRKFKSETGQSLSDYINQEKIQTANKIAACYASELHYCINGSAISADEIVVQTERIEYSEEVAWGDVKWHGSWAGEQRLFKSIMEGQLVDMSKDRSGNIGNIGGGDPLRQAKNEILIFSVICSRAAILGGVSAEGSYTLSDYFIQLIEAAETIPEVMNIGAEMQRTYVQRVQKAKANSGRSSLVRSCMEYVATHIFEKISLHAMTQELGYNEHYISRKFKSETGQSLSDYINQEKIQTAKLILTDTRLSVAEISDRLSFSSPSYFGSVFRKQTGMSPAEYQQSKKEANQ